MHARSTQVAVLDHGSKIATATFLLKENGESDLIINELDVILK